MDENVTMMFSCSLQKKNGVHYLFFFFDRSVCYLCVCFRWRVKVLGLYRKNVTILCDEITLGENESMLLYCSSQKFSVVKSLILFSRLEDECFLIRQVF